MTDSPAAKADPPPKKAGEAAPKAATAAAEQPKPAAMPAAKAAAPKPDPAPATADVSKPSDAAPPRSGTPVEPAPSPRRGGILAPILGGLIAAGLGFGVAQYVPEGWPLGPGTGRLTALQRQIADQNARIAALSAQDRPAVDESLGPRLAALEAAATPAAELEALHREVEALKARLATLPEGSAPADLAPLRAELSQQITALRAEFEALPRSNPADLDALREAAKAEREAIEARAEATRAEAEATARAALVRGAVLRVQAALDTGAAFDAALTDLGAAGVALPDALAAHAGGVPALSSLQTRFPEAARQALAASSRPGADAGIGDRFTAFLSAQTGLRSLTPQEGASPDAVLSRAEAAVEAGDLARALHELDALPPEAAAALAEWRSAAETRLAATAAAQSLIADLDKP